MGACVGEGDGSKDGVAVGANVGGSDGVGVGAIEGSGDGAGVGENVSTETDRTDADDIERRRPLVSPPAEDPSRRWPSAVANSIIAVVRVPWATDALSTLVTCCHAPNCTRAVRRAIPS